MRVPADELLPRASQRALHREQPLVLRDVREENQGVEHVAELLLHVLGVLLIHRLEEFCDLLPDMLPDAREGLLPVPRASARRAEFPAERDQLVEGGHPAGGGRQIYMSIPHCAGMRWLWVLLPLAVLASCAPARWEDHAYVVMDGGRGPVGVRAEVVAEQPERELGLMHRASLGEQQGMLFVFDQPQVVGFWMKNMLIPLDMMFIDEDWRIVQIAEDVQPCTAEPCEVTYSRDEVLYVLEVSAGFVDRWTLSPGSRVLLSS